MKYITLALLPLLISILFGYSCKPSGNEIQTSLEEAIYSEKTDETVKKETVKISYCRYSNSGLAISTWVEIYKDSLIWDYSEHRNDCHLRDVVKYDSTEFKNLIDALSQFSFSVERGIPTCGGEGESYSFSTNSGRYLEIDDDCVIEGDFEKVSELIRQFIQSHPTDGEKEFKRLSRLPHERAAFGQFEVLPEELEIYRVKR